MGSFQFWNIVRNTVVIAFVRIGFAFPVPIILALALNEMRWMQLRRSIQTIALAPHFISTVVMAGVALTGGSRPSKIPEQGCPYALRGISWMREDDDRYSFARSR